jgi:nodulation protein E
MDLGLKGPSYTTVSACSSSNNAIGQAFWLLRSGISSRAITGGADATFSYVHLKAWEALRVVAPDLCQPFCADRKGMMLGEGAAMLVLETLEAAHARKAAILAEVVGYGCTADAVHLTSPDVNGAARAMEAALMDAQLDKHRHLVGYINAHGTGTQVNDAMETLAIRQVFGSHADQLAVSSTKSMHGHALGASSAMEAVATVMALKNGILPPTANYTKPDPACDLDVIPNQSREQQVEYAMSNAFAFGGLNAVVVFRRWNHADNLPG